MCDRDITVMSISISNSVSEKTVTLCEKIVTEYAGLLLKTKYKGYFFYFESAQKGMQAAAAIQKKNYYLNLKNTSADPMENCIGLYTESNVELDDKSMQPLAVIALKLQHKASMDEIIISGSTYEKLDNKGEFFCKLLKEYRFNGKNEVQPIYKVFWDEDKILEIDKVVPVSIPNHDTFFSLLPIIRLLVFFTVIIGSVFLTMKLSDYFASRPDIEDKRSRHLSVSGNSENSQSMKNQ